MTNKAHLSVTISHSLRAELEASRDVHGRTMSAELEARLRDSLGSLPTDGFVVLKLDDGLMAWVRALHRCHFVGPTVEETITYLIRTQIIDYMSNEHWKNQIVQELDEPWRSNNG